MDLRELLEEMKRRRVVRAALGYAAALFVVLQVANIVIPALDLPDSVLTGLLVVGILGFPLAMILAWAVDLTPDGVQRARLNVGAAEEASSRFASFRTAAGLLVAVAVVIGTAWWITRPRSHEEIRALAVLPLSNLTGDDAQAHFVEGLHDVLIGELSHVDSLAVISRTSVMRYRDTRKTVREIADELNVQALLEGSVFRQGDTVRVNVQLIRARPEDHVWENRYEGRLSQALALQARIAQSVAQEIELALSETTAEYFAGRDTTEVDPAAQEAYLRAMALWRTRDRENLVQAVEFYEEAVRIDPGFARGWAGVANGYTVAVGYQALDMNRDSAIVIAERAARRALSLEPSLVEGRVALGAILIFGRHDYRQAEGVLSRAIELAPSNAQAHDWLGDALMAQGRLEEAIRQYEEATRLDPFSPLMHRDYARALAMAERCEEAVPEAETALDLDPRHFYASEILRSCALQAGRTDEAVQITLDIAESVGSYLAADELLAAYESSGVSGLMEYEARLFMDRGGPFVLAAVRFAQVGLVDEAFGALRRALESRDALLTLVRVHPALEPLRGDPRWEEVLSDLADLPEQDPTS